MLKLLQDYIAINTAYPNPDYRAAVNLFKQQAIDDGFLVTELALPSGNPVLIITWQGSSAELPCLALNHHMDVVPADNAPEWLFPPFAGTIDNDLLYGRGTQDCKGLGVAQYGALQALKKSGFNPSRTIHYLVVPDEERGGFLGTKELVNHPLFASLNIGYVLDEGMPSGNDQELLIKVDERTPLQILVTSSGPQGHASGLLHRNCIHSLTAFLNDIVTFQTQQQLLDDEPGNVISMQITSLTTNNTALNVIPSQAKATIDIRIPSHIPLDDGIALLDALIKKYPTLEYTILATSQERCKSLDLNSTLYKTLAKAVTDYGLTPKPFAFEATTDARFYSHRGIQAVGFTPFSCKPNLHGTNESIRIKDLEQGIAILQAFLRAFCT